MLDVMINIGQSQPVTEEYVIEKLKKKQQDEPSFLNKELTQEVLPEVIPAILQNKKIEIIQASISSLKDEKVFRKHVLFNREFLFWFLLLLMLIYTFVLFLIILLSSLIPPVLYINPSVLQILVGATVTQISVMLFVIIKSLYSDNINQMFINKQNGSSPNLME